MARRTTGSVSGGFRGKWEAMWTPPATTLINAAALTGTTGGTERVGSLGWEVPCAGAALDAWSVDALNGLPPLS
ncbi:hypothetical protein D3C83_190490 [compost metagenome]